MCSSDLTGDGGLYSLQLKIPGQVRYTTGIRSYRISPLRKVDLTSAALRDLRGRAVKIYGRMPVMKIVPLPVSKQK